MAQQIYFVRHGVTVANEKNIVQGFDDVLSPKGLGQAHMLASRLSHISFGKLLSSDMTRTKQTAEIVAGRTKHEIEYSPLFREIQYPESLLGISRSDPQVLEYWLQQEESGRTNPDWKMEGEESITELIARICDGFEYAASQPEEDVVVITHGNFMRKLFLIKMLPDDAAKYWTERSSLITVSNTGITLFRRRHEATQPNWQLITWNDHAHLG